MPSVVPNSTLPKVTHSIDPIPMLQPTPAFFGRTITLPHQIDPDTLCLTQQIIHDLGPQATPAEWDPYVQTRDRSRQHPNRLLLNSQQVVARNQELADHRKNLDKSMRTIRKFVEMKEKLEQLTINQYRGEILNLVSNNECSMLVAGTASGKTTQLPQILLDDAVSLGKGANTNIICTQPRVIAATSVARRVAAERNDGVTKSVGYHVRFDYYPPRPGGILYCTTGILLMQMRHSLVEALDHVSHIIVDETHERDIEIDTLLALLKTALRTRKQAGLQLPKVILASATLDVDLFSKYFMQIGKDGSQQLCPSLSIPGRVFKVTENYLADVLKDFERYPKQMLTLLTEDKKTHKYMQLENAIKENPSFRDLTEEETALVPLGLVVLTIANIIRTTAEGSILVFLPGLSQIVGVEKHFSSKSPLLGIDLTDTIKYKVILLHGDLPDAQIEVFEPVPPGVRKIILSTNIAETSVTIPDVKYVVVSTFITLFSCEYYISPYQSSNSGLI
jgi:ATP-dependent RNA helicase DHX36